jgi:hypothetical protein
MRYLDLHALRTTSEEKRQAFEASIAANFPGLNRWHWSRACAAIRGENVRRNDDQSQDAALAADEDIRTAHDAYIAALHAYYRARDGEGGFLGRASS